MNGAEETDPVLRVVDAVITDLAVRPARHVGRRAQDGDSRTFVLQDGEEGRLRLALPVLGQPGSVVAMTRDAQSYLSHELGEPVPRCPHHDHQLDLAAVDAGFAWVCPAGRWRCALGEYAEAVWPQFDVEQLPGLLAGRLARREINGVSSISVTDGADGRVARFGVAEITSELGTALRDAAAPLGVEVHEQQNLPRRLGSRADAPRFPEPSNAPAVAAAVRLELAERRPVPGCDLPFTVVNDGTAPILMGVDYAIERQADDQWEPLPGAWFTAAGVVVDPGQREELIARLPDSAPPGTYRLRKVVRQVRYSADARTGSPNPDDPRIELTTEFRVARL